jgi:hypothetical protein
MRPAALVPPAQGDRGGLLASTVEVDKLPFAWEKTACLFFRGREPMNPIGVSLLLLSLLPAEDKPTPKFSLGKETTYVAGPLDKEGYIDDDPRGDDQGVRMPPPELKQKN